MTTAETVREFIATDLGVAVEPGQLTEDVLLIDSGIIDSLQLFELVTFLEDEFGIEVADEELVPENFGTIADIARLVSAKQTRR